MPLPNLPGPDGTMPDFNNYFHQPQFTFNRWTIDSKINWNVTDRLQIFGRYSQLDFYQDNETDLGPQLQGAFAAEQGYFDVSTLREPYRIEGKKTMGLEVAEQLGWHLPTHIIYPTGGGTGLIGMWKVFRELATLGWLPRTAQLPRMIVAQAEGCAPIVRAWSQQADRATPWENPTTHAAGLRVPAPLGDRLILRAVREDERVLLLDVEDIVWIRANRNVVQLHARGKVHELRETMATLATRLDPARFARVHRSAIVNRNRVRALRAARALLGPGDQRRARPRPLLAAAQRDVRVGGHRPRHLRGDAAGAPAHEDRADRLCRHPTILGTTRREARSP